MTCDAAIRPAEGSTRVVCAFHPAWLRRGTRDELLAQDPGTEFRDVSADDHAYWRLLVELWRDGRDFLLCEHDALLAPGAVEALERCPAPWCACASTAHPDAAWLQCNRWRGDLTRAHPDLFDLPPEHRDWRVLDHHVLRALLPIAEPHYHSEHLTFHLAADVGRSR